ncbi:hypothetical protein C8J56DRAFT_1160821 [Mycena floridula]|nr:hypothetical protein C8J56DRAFT_1160821 [Mycena floridula]
MAETTPIPSTKPRRPAFETWPTIKVLTFPTGRLSPAMDEWCVTSCRQSVTGRFHGRNPTCTTICIRKVFPHEVRNILSYKRHTSGAAVSPDGRVKYPLPPEGQPANLPKLLGGKRPRDTDSDDSESPPPQEPKHWNEGWYLWSSSGFRGVIDRLDLMRYDIQGAQVREQHRIRAREKWTEYQEYLERQSTSESQEIDSKWYGAVVPQQPPPDSSPMSLLVPLPPEFTLFDRLTKVLDPTKRSLDIFRESVKSGSLRDVGVRIWDKAFTNEPFTLAQRACSRAYEMWKAEPPEEEGGKKKSR